MNIKSHPSFLVDGLIPIYTACPFSDFCELKAADACDHKGVDHNVAFSCAAARGFDIFQVRHPE